MAEINFKQPVMGRRAFVGSALAASALAALAGCGGKGGNGGGSKGGKVMNFYLSEPAFIDPYNAQENQGTSMVRAMFDGLVTWDWDKNAVTPVCADELPTISEDGLVYTFKLKKGMKFHNGDAVDAESFKRGWTRLVDPNMKSPSQIGYHLDPVAGVKEFAAGDAKEISGLKVVDDLTFEVTLVAPMYDFLAVCCHPGLVPVPQCALDDPKSFLEQPVGNGPFMMEEPWKHNQYINLVAFPDYYGDKPKLDGVYCPIIKDPDTAFKEFTGGNVDFAMIPTGRVKECEDKYGVSKDGFTVTPGKQCLNGTELSVYFLVLNMQQDPFQDVDVRRAFSLAIDRQAIADAIYEGVRQPADSIMPKVIDDDPKNVWTYCKFDPEQAKALLDAKYPADADGKRDLHVVLNYNGDGGHGELMSMVQSDLEKVGFQVKQETTEWATYLQNMTDGNFSAGRMGWTADYPTMDNMLYPNFYSTADNNFMHYEVPEVDAALLAARQIADDEARKEACREICHKVGEDCPIVPIVFYAHNYVGSERLKSFNYDSQTIPHFETAELV